MAVFFVVRWRDIGARRGNGTVSIGSGFTINHIGMALRSGGNASSRVAFSLDRGRSRRNNPAS